MDIDDEDVLRNDAIIPKAKSRVFGGEKKRLKVKVDGNLDATAE